MLICRRRFDQRIFIAKIVNVAFLRHAVEECKHTVEILLLNRVVLVIVAARAAQSEPQPNVRRGLRAVRNILHAELLRHNAAFRAGPVIPVKRRGDALVQSGIRQQVAGNLLNGELIERHVLLERFNHPIAPAPHIARAIGLIAVCIRVPGRLHPTKSHALGIARRRQQTVDRLLVSIRGVVVEERLYIFRGRRQTGEIQGHAPDQPGPVSLNRGLQPFHLQPRQNEPIDGIPGPLCKFHFRQRRAHGCNERPMRLPLRALLNPPANHIDIRLDQFVVARIGRRHACRFVGGVDPLIQLTLGGIAWDNHANRAALHIETQLGLAIRRVGTVARKTLVR